MPTVALDYNNNGVRYCKGLTAASLLRQGLTVITIAAAAAAATDDVVPQFYVLFQASL